MGRDGAVSGIPPVPAFHSTDGQQSINLYPYNPQPGCSWSPVGRGIGRIQHEAGVSEGGGQQGSGYLE